MKKKFLLCFLAACSFGIGSTFALGVSVIGGKPGKVEIEITNDSEKPVYLNHLNGDLIEVRLEIWSLDKGVIVYPKNDAVWRRAQAFVDSRWTLLEANGKKKLVVDLSELLPASATNDELAKKILEEASFLENFKMAVVVSYRDTPGSESALHEARKDLTLVWPK